MPRFFRSLAVLTVLVPLLLSASAEGPRLVLAFADDVDSLVLTGPSGASLKAAEGMSVVPGTTIRTGSSTVELRLTPNGSALKLARNTVFRVRSLQELAGAKSNAFEVLDGKIRMIAAKVSGAVNAYDVFTPRAQAGVRGTDFAVEANEDEGDWVCVKEGVVSFTRLATTEKPAVSVLVGVRQFANIHSPTLAVKNATDDDLADKFGGLDFRSIKETEVPGHGAL